MPNARYGCSQTTFYAAGHIGVDRLSDNLDDFTAEDADYTVKHMQGIKSRLNAADALPDHDARRLTADLLWAEVTKQRKEGTYAFGLFLSKIDKICPEDMRPGTYDAAGRKHYMDAKGGDDAKMVPMYSSLNPYIRDNWTALSTVAKMTTVQRDDLLAKEALYKTTYDAANKAEQAVNDRRDEKVNANNACFDEIVVYTKFAQRIYADDPLMAKSFTFAAFRAEVETVKNAGLAGKITNILNKEPLKGATITILNYNKVAVTEKNGRFEITPLSMDKYTVIVECPGFETQTFKDVKIKTGKTTRLNVKMVAVAAA